MVSDFNLGARIDAKIRIPPFLSWSILKGSGVQILYLRIWLYQIFLIFPQYFSIFCWLNLKVEETSGKINEESSNF